VSGLANARRQATPLGTALVELRILRRRILRRWRLVRARITGVLAPAAVVPLLLRSIATAAFLTVLARLLAFAVLAFLLTGLSLRLAALLLPAGGGLLLLLLLLLLHPLRGRDQLVELADDRLLHAPRGQSRAPRTSFLIDRITVV
jgi:hypothetical protein